MSKTQTSFDRFEEPTDNQPEEPDIWGFDEYGPTMDEPAHWIAPDEFVTLPGSDVDARQLPGSGLSIEDFELVNQWDSGPEKFRKVATGEPPKIHPDDRHRPDRVDEWAEKAAEFGRQELAADGGEEPEKFEVRTSDGIGPGIHVKTFDDREEAHDHAEKMNATGEGTDLSYYVEPITAEELEDREERFEEALETIQDSSEEESEVSTDGGQQLQKPQKTLGFDPEEETVTQDWEGEFLSTMWGYDQTNVDFAKIVDVSGTGKTVLARKTKAERVDTGRTSKQVRPIDEPHGDEFRLHVREGYNGDPVFRGSYPLGPNGDMDDGTRKGGFDHWGEEEESIRETATNYGH